MDIWLLSINPARLLAEKSFPSSSLLVTTVTKSSRPLSQHEKYRKALLLSSELASALASAASNVHFERRIELLSRLTDHWRRGEEVTVTKVVDYGKYILFCYTLFIFTLKVLTLVVNIRMRFLIESASENECEVHEPEYVDTHGVGLEG